MSVLDVSPDADLAAVLTQLARLLDGDGPAVVPVAAETPTLPGLPGPGVAVIATSGSTGRPKQVLLPGPALRASGLATADRLGGHGQWVLALPAQHVAGLQVLCRSALAGTVPVRLPPGPFSAVGFAAAVARLTGSEPRYASLVPTQLTRLLADPGGIAALGELSAVLVGGAALPASLRAEVDRIGVRVVTTYGMTETGGGCVYDGVPLEGVQVRLGAGGQVELGGPVVASGYLGDPAGTEERFGADGSGTRWFRTDDLGEVDAAGGLRVLGRADDVINTGGHKVSPGLVQAAVEALPQVSAAHVQGVPDPEWGSVVAVVAVADDWPSGPASADLIVALRHLLRPQLPAYALPRQLLVVPELPLLGTGKVDRLQLGRALAAGDGRM